MPLNVYKYCRKKRNVFDFLRYCYLKNKRKSIKKQKEWTKKYDKNSETRIKGEYTWQEEKEFFSDLRGWKQFLIAITPFCLLVVFGCYGSNIIKNYGETIVSVLLLILYGIGWLIGIVVAFIVTKMFFVFLYHTSVNIISNFIVDIWKEVEKKRKKDNV